MEPPFDGLPGVIATTSGYAGGTTDSPSYREVTAGGTGHVEVVEVRYDPARISYPQLLEVYWRQVDPFDPDGQFCDQGDSYRPAIFALTADQRSAAEASKAAVEARLGQPVAVRIEPPARFWPAEEYHQDYYQKNPARYRFYRAGCGRDARLRAVWGAVK
jgi:peptide-methionine (S)-S-oxide reductase